MMTEPGTVVIALGGNALMPPGEKGDIHQQFEHTRVSLAPVVALAREGWRIVVVHGNGPQIGDELLRNERAGADLPPLPLGVLVAGTAGWIGYMVQQSLQNALKLARVRRLVVTMITQVAVDPDAAATREPIKPIGRRMDEATARRLADEFGWTVGRDGDGWRRLVASPIPTDVVECEQIRRLVESGTIVIALGGGGTPIYRDAAKGLEGIDGVVDKDRAAQVLARDIGADTFLILTNVDGVYRAFGTADQELLRVLPAQEAQRMLEAGEFGKGSMEPKVEAALEFVRQSGGRAVIARLDRGIEAVRGEAGTTIIS